MWTGGGKLEAEGGLLLMSELQLPLMMLNCPRLVDSWELLPSPNWALQRPKSPTKMRLMWWE